MGSGFVRLPDPKVRPYPHLDISLFLVFSCYPICNGISFVDFYTLLIIGHHLFISNHVYSIVGEMISFLGSIQEDWLCSWALVFTFISILSFVDPKSLLSGHTGDS